MNAMMPVSYRLFAAALAENSVGLRPRPRPEKQVVIELSGRETAANWLKKTPPVMSREVRFDSRLNACG